MGTIETSPLPPSDKKVYTSLHHLDIRRAILAMPSMIEVLLQDNLCKDAFVAGGWIRATVMHEEDSDIDIFAQDSHDFLNGNLATKSGARGIVSEGATMYNIDGVMVHVVHKWKFSSPCDAIDAFDFTICQAAIQWSQHLMDWVGVCSPPFYPDLAARRLTYLGAAENRDVARSVFRALRYVKRGYYLAEPTLARLVFDAVEATGSFENLLHKAEVDYI